MCLGTWCASPVGKDFPLGGGGLGGRGEGLSVKKRRLVSFPVASPVRTCRVSTSAGLVLTLSLHSAFRRSNRAQRPLLEDAWGNTENEGNCPGLPRQKRWPPEIRAGLQEIQWYFTASADVLLS